MTVDFATKQDIEELKTLIEMQNLLIHRMIKANHEDETIDVKAICSLKGISRTDLMRKPYLMPNFGESEYPGRRRWNLSTYEEWEKEPVISRERRWRTKLANDNALAGRRR